MCLIGQYCAYGEKMRIEYDNRNSLSKITNLVWLSRDISVNGKKMNINLLHQCIKSEKRDEFKLIGYMDGQEYVLWRTETRGYRLPPLEYSFDVSSDEHLAGICVKPFYLEPATVVVFYEVNIVESLREAEATNSHSVAPSAWIDEETTKRNDQRQVVRLFGLENVSIPNEAFTENITLHNLNGRWMFSFDVKGRLPATRYYYQYPVGGTGLTFVKKELVPEVTKVTPSTIQCMQNLERLRRAKLIMAGGMKKKPGDILDTNILYGQILKNVTLKCPDGGEYELGNVGDMPKCSIHGVYRQVDRNGHFIEQ